MNLIAKHLFRRLSILPALLLAIGNASVSGATGVDVDANLRAPADQRGLLLGVALRPEDFSFTVTGGYGGATDIVSSNFNLVVPEYQMQMAVLSTAQEAPLNFTAVDRVADYAVAHHMRMHGTSLLWCGALPQWLIARLSPQSQNPISDQELEAFLHQYITDVISHFTTNYPGLVVSWDVANESLTEEYLATHEPDGSLRATPDSVKYPWRRVGLLHGSPLAHLPLVFQWARKADPGALLFYNDYDRERLGPRSDLLYSQVMQWRAQGVPIDGVGFQAHDMFYSSEPVRTLAQIQATNFTISDLQINLIRFAQLGLKVRLSEVDVLIPNSGVRVDRTAGYGMPTPPSYYVPNDPTALAYQRDRYSSLLSACLYVKECVSFTVWGSFDGLSWYGGVGVDPAIAPLSYPLLFDEAVTGFAHKPAFQALSWRLQQSDTELSQNLIASSGGNWGTAPWSPVQSQVSLQNLDPASNAGLSSALAVKARGASWAGPQQILSGPLSSGVYYASAWLRLAIGGPATGTASLVLLTMKQGVATYTVLGASTVTAGVWTLVEGLSHLTSPQPPDFALVYLDVSGGGASPPDYLVATPFLGLTGRSW